MRKYRVKSLELKSALHTLSTLLTTRSGCRGPLQRRSAKALGEHGLVGCAPCLLDPPLTRWRRFVQILLQAREEGRLGEGHRDLPRHLDRALVPPAQAQLRAFVSRPMLAIDLTFVASSAAGRRSRSPSGSARSCAWSLWSPPSWPSAPTATMSCATRPSSSARLGSRSSASSSPRARSRPVLYSAQLFMLYNSFRRRDHARQTDRQDAKTA